MNDPVFVLDSYGLIYRSYYAFGSKPLINSDGENVSAVFGFFRSLSAILQKRKPRFFAAAFDSRVQTFRHELYPEYKANRQKTPDDLHSQIPVIEEILSALGIYCIRQDGFEADDVIASIAAKCASEKRGCVILSGDKDLVQLEGEFVSILEPGKNGGWEEVTGETVRKKWGIEPSQILDFLSLTGDRSDNVPGVPGIGEVTAAKLLACYGSLDGIYAAADEIQGAAGKKIREGKENAYFSKRLISLSSEVPLPGDFSPFECTSLNGEAAAVILLKKGLPNAAKLYTDEKKFLELKKSLPEKNKPRPSKGEENPGLWDQTEGGKFFEPPPFSNLVFQPDEIKKNAGRYSAVFSEKELSEIVDRALGNGFAAFDCETTGLDVLKSSLVGFSISVTPGEGFYIPLKCPGLEGNSLIPEEKALKEIERLFSAPKFLLITHNGKFDLQIMKASGLKEPACMLFDTMIAAWVIDPDFRSFSLETLAESFLGLKGREYSEVVPKNGTFADVPLEEAAEYASEDADFTLQLYNFLKPKLKEGNAGKIFREIEMPLVPVLAEMEMLGIALDKSQLETFSIQLGKDIEKTAGEIYGLAGHEFNISSPKQLQEVLFDERKLPPGKKTKTGYSTDTSVLEDLASEDPLPGKILDYRALAKLKSGYADALPELADSQGRIHTNFIQTGTATGRLSSRDPNLQNIPVRDESGRRIRKAFNAPEGKLLVSADYSQIELTLLAHFSRDENLVLAFNEGVDVHSRTAGLIFGVPSDKVTPEMRRTAKTINFGVMYGMSAFRLANQLRIPRKQAAVFINSYFATYSGVSQFIALSKEKAAETGWVETIMGRRRYIRGINSQNRIERSAAERIAVNTPIQGSAADIVKTAMIKTNEALRKEKSGAVMLLQVHDELIFEAPENEAEKTGKLVREIMESVVKLNVPLKVSVETGKCWGDFH